MIWIAVDAMGGDDAPGHVVDGALAAARHFDLGVALVGLWRGSTREIARHPDVDPAQVRLVARRRRHRAWPNRRRRRCGASRAPRFRVAAELVARGEAAALFSAGHTGATVMAAHAAFGMLPGVDRPALAATIPTRREPALLLDVGASVECRPSHLLQFARDGQRVRARRASASSGRGSALLSIGEEETKGNELTREAHRLLKASPLAFIGNIEARDIYSGDADVIVCDGFTGNVALKISEGLVEVVEELLRDELTSTYHDAVGVAADAARAAALPPPRGLLGVRRRAAARRGRARHRRPRPIERQGRAQRRGDGVRFASSRFIERVEQEIAAATVSHS